MTITNVDNTTSNVTTDGSDPSMEYQGYATAEVWIGRSPVNVGVVTGSALYGTIWNILRSDCAFKDSGCKKGDREYSFDTQYAFESFFIRKGGNSDFPLVMLSHADLKC